MEILLLAALGGMAFLYWENHKIKNYLAAIEGRLRLLDQKEAEEAGALVGALRDINAHNLIFRGLLRDNPEVSTFLKNFAEDYPISSEDDVDVMRTVVDLTKKWAVSE